MTAAERERLRGVVAAWLEPDDVDEMVIELEQALGPQCICAQRAVVIALGGTFYCPVHDQRPT